jgi:hypothetical protein
MGINGTWAAITVPKWQVVMWAFIGTVFGAGITVGLNFATREGRYDARIGGVEHGVTSLSARVDRIGARVDSLVVLRLVDTRVLDALGRLRCLDGTPRNLTNAADLPCAALLGASRAVQ